MTEILQLVAMATLIPGLVLHLMVRRHRTELARSLPWYSRAWWWWPRPKIETLLTARGLTLFRIARPLIYVGVIAYVIIRVMEWSA